MENTVSFSAGLGLRLEIAFRRRGGLFLGHPGSASGIFQMVGDQPEKESFSIEKKGKIVGLVYRKRCVAIFCKGEENFRRNCKGQKLNFRANALIFASVI